MITAIAAKNILGAVGRRIKVRWLLLVGAAAALCLLGAKYITETYMFLQWLGVALTVGVVGEGIWQAACKYYTGQWDIPGDGIKPTGGRHAGF